jgi:hypothetical protein
MSFYCFRFPTRQQFRTLAAAQGLIDADGNLITSSHTHALDEVGTIHEGGTYTTEGEVITPPTALSGWHVNTIGLAPEAWDQYLVVVNSPARIFLGGAAQAPDSATLEAMNQ